MNFIFNTHTKWDEPPRARHQLAKALSKKHRVIFIAANKIGKPKIKYNIKDKNLELIQPFFPLSYKIIKRLPILNELYQNWLFHSINYKDNLIVINFAVNASQIFKYFNKVIYYCNDNFLDKNRAGNFFVSLYFRFTQKNVAKKSNFCVGVSKYIVKQLKNINPKSYQILTAADKKSIDCFYKPKNKRNDKIIVTYVGWIQKINVEWIIELAKNKNYLINLIGPYKNKVRKNLSQHDNIVLVGPMVGDKLQEYLHNCDVTIAPYIAGKDTEEVYTMPNKFWLYIASGKPIVTCQIKNLLKLPEKFVYQSKDKYEFAKKINLAYQENSPELVKERERFIRQNTWEDRAKEIIKLIEKQI